MKAMAIEQYGSLDNLKLMDLPVPEPKDNEVQIKVEYAGVNPVDWKICEGLLKGRVPEEFPITIGWDVAGVISKTGSHVSHLKEGDMVFAYARQPVLHLGTYAEYVIFDAQHVVKKPSHLNFAQAAGIPLTSLTAWQALNDVVALKEGETILIHAGAGGVGGVAIQIAHHLKCRVITTARESNFAHLKELGADFVIDYTKENFVDAVKKIAPKGIDVVFDTMGGKTQEESYKVLKEGGRLVSIVQPPDKAMAEKLQVKAFYHFVRPDGAQLKEIAHLYEKGTFQPLEVEEFPLAKAKEALEKLKTGHVRGKIVLKVQ